MYGVENIRSDISGDASNFWQFHIMVWFIDQYLYFQNSAITEIGYLSPNHTSYTYNTSVRVTANREFRNIWFLSAMFLCLRDGLVHMGRWFPPPVK